MTNNQLTVPETSNEQIALVQQILDDPRELAPSVQVRFAKRVGRPGASRVMLMDAQTSGPIADEDEESISNLALRLADGTNVQLSLSFFNDNQPALAGASMGGGGRRATFAPFNTYVYEPRSYTIHKNESKLPLIMMTTAIVLAAGCYGLITGPFSNYLQTKAAKPVTATAIPKTAPKAAPIKVATIHAAPKIVHEPIPAPPPMTFEVSNPFKTGSKKISSGTRTSRTHIQSQSSRTGHSSRNEMFVPPPPPMTFASAPPVMGFVPPPPPTPYTVPAGIPAAFDPLQSLAPAVARSRRVYTPPKKLESIAPSSTSAESKMPIVQSAAKDISYEKPAAVQQSAETNWSRGQQLLEQTPTSAPAPIK
jgi:hypothetical protein